MTVLFVFNGAFNFRSPTEFNVNSILQARSTRKRAITGEEEDEENSMNSRASAMNNGKRPRR